VQSIDFVVMEAKKYDEISMWW